jgi:hypothetical protein
VSPFINKASTGPTTRNTAHTGKFTPGIGGELDVGSEPPSVVHSLRTGMGTLNAAA